MLGGGLDPRVLERIKAMNGMGAAGGMPAPGGDDLAQKAAMATAPADIPAPGPDMGDASVSMGDPSEEAMKLAAALDAAGADAAQSNMAPDVGLSGGPAPIAPPPEAAAVEEYIKSQSMAAPAPMAVRQPPPPPPAQMPPAMATGGPPAAMAAAGAPPMPIGPDGPSGGGMMDAASPIPPGDLARMQADQFRQQLMRQKMMGR